MMNKRKIFKDFRLVIERGLFPRDGKREWKKIGHKE